MARIAMLGLGAMGSRMAGRLIEAGHEVTVYNRTASAAEALVEQGARRAMTPRQAADGAAFVLSMVTDDHASRQVWLSPDDGAIHGLPPHAIAVESSTLSPTWVVELSNALSEHGHSFIEAPVAGSRPQADAGALIHLAGGDARVVERVEPILKELSAAVHYVGPIGAGATFKLVVNGLFGVQVAVAAELLAFARREGLEASRFVELLGSMPVTSPAARGAMTSMATGAFAPQFPIDLVAKDFRYVLQAARSPETPVPVLQATADVFSRALDVGLGHENISAVAKLYAGAE